MYILAALDAVYYAVGRIAGWFTSLDQFIASWSTNWATFILLGRFAGAVAGTLTVAAVYRMGTALFDRMTAVIGALFLALAFLHVRDSHFAVTDVTMTLFVVVSVLAAFRGYVQDDTRLFALAGLFAGFGASVKYNAALAVAPAAVAIVLTASERRDGRRRRVHIGRAAMRLVLCAAAAGVAFVAGSPYAVLDRARFVHDIAGVARHISATHGGIDLGIGGIYHLKFSLWYGLGPPLLLAGLLGLAWMLVSDWRKAVLLGAFPLVYYAALFDTRTVFVRYAIPLAPFLCLAAATIVTAAARRLARRRPGALMPVAACLSLIVIAPSAYSVAQIDRLFVATDSRLIVADWLREHAPRGSSIYLAGSITVRPFIESGSTTFHYWDYDGGTRFSEGPGPIDGLPEWIVIPETPLPGYNYVTPYLQALTAEHYDVAQVITAIAGSEHVFDRQDAFFYPYAGFARVTRGGPNFYVYQRRAE